jgi:ribosome-associated toxin RatA of RatAB toxin-antitoxin module
MHELELTTRIDTDPQAIFDAVLDIEGQSATMEHLRGVEVLESTPDTKLIRMDEHVDGTDVSVTSRFTFDRPRWVAYEHVESPFGANEGRFEITEHEGHCELRQVHRTEQDLDARPTLRDDWIGMMRRIHATIASMATSGDESGDGST